MRRKLEGSAEKCPVGSYRGPSAQCLPLFEHTGAVQVHLTAPRASGTFNFLEQERNQPLWEFVPDLCQRIADLDVLADLARRKNSKLRGINDGRGIKSVPGHHIFNHLQPVKNAISFRFIPKHWSVETRLSG
jgi:hypothetical protein